MPKKGESVEDCIRRKVADKMREQEHKQRKHKQKVAIAFDYARKICQSKHKSRRK